jgi:hypothetical protein
MKMLILTAARRKTLSPENFLFGNKIEITATRIVTINMTIIKV